MEEAWVCKIPSLEEMEEKWAYEIAIHPNSRANWVTWRQEALENFQKGYNIPYYGLLGQTILCEATANLAPAIVQNSQGLVGEHTAYLSAFRTIAPYRGKGYFSKLMQFMLNDLKQRGITRVTLGVSPTSEKNKQIYRHFGFTEYIKSAAESNPDGTAEMVEYYGRQI